MLTQEFTFATGIIPGYNHNNGVKSPVSRLAEVWREAADAVWCESGEYVSAVLHETRTVYRIEWGCLMGGEVTVFVTGIRNPEFQKDETLWRSCVRRVCERVKLTLCQATGYLSFRDVDFEYMR